MYNLTQTTENRSSQGRIGPPTTSTRKSLCRYVGATSLRLDHAPTREATIEHCRILLVPCISGRSRPTGLYRTYERDQHGYLFRALLYYSTTGARKRKSERGRFHPAPWNGAGLPAPLVKKHFKG